MLIRLSITRSVEAARRLAAPPVAALACRLAHLVRHQMCGDLQRCQYLSTPTHVQFHPLYERSYFDLDRLAGKALCRP